MTKTYKFSDSTQLAEHFNISEFLCKCGKNHDTILNPELPEKTRKALQITELLKNHHQFRLSLYSS